MKNLTRCGLAVALLFVSYSVRAESGPECVRFWTRALTTKTGHFEHIYDGMLSQANKLYDKVCSKCDPVAFMAYQCGMDPALTRTIALDEIAATASMR